MSRFADIDRVLAARLAEEMGVVHAMRTHTDDAPLCERDAWLCVPHGSICLVLDSPTADPSDVTCPDCLAWMHA